MDKCDFREAGIEKAASIQMDKSPFNLTPSYRRGA
jgi:hypothetical protein